ncbi:RagB/SusD family nutrient uptake outer membrane protein [Parabacteroides johnsonii]|uniref:RagB/SusD family nutrient uptake outer membrane protein n=1 Tax=Parabacteroides johnsonii TaxID=387661 RepID=UPI0011DD005B|nr:RagB/SusD family nutrient uptake outer membrane protein [Parabacteroides johnsonii]
MKNVFNILLGTLLFIMSSCDDFFELKRPQETQWTTTSTLEQGLSTAYWNLHWTGGMGRGCPQYFDFITSGSAKLLDGTSVGVSYSQPYYRMFDQKLGESKETWLKGYQIITLANLALDLDRDGNGNPFNLDVKSDDYVYNYKRQIAEYHFLRGYTYFYLVKFFGTPYDPNGNNESLSIPLKTTAAYSKEDVMNEKIGTVKEVYDVVIQDLQYAKENLPEQYTLNSWNNVPGYECGRGNKIIAAALLGKVYFLMGKYDLAQKEFDYVIDYAEQTGRYRLEDPQSPFIENAAANRPLESIWEFNSGQLDGKSEKHNMYVYYGMIMGLRFRDSNGSDFYNVSDPKDGIVMSSWNCFTVGYWALKRMGWMVDPENGDYTITSAAEEDLRYQQVYHLMLPYEKGIKKGDEKYITHESVDAHAQVSTPHVYLDKFFRGEKPYGRYSKYPLIRLADLYLLRAWLRWNGGEYQQAADDMNVVWNRSNPQNPNRYNSSNVNHTEIFNEYLREMTGEGWTVDFMMGTRMPIPAGDAKGNTVVAPPYSSWHWPIPDEETSLNPNYR